MNCDRRLRYHADPSTCDDLAEFLDPTKRPRLDEWLASIFGDAPDDRARDSITRLVSLDEIDTSSITGLRDGLDDARIAQMAELVSEDSDALLPPLCFEIGDRVLLCDGLHRLRAHRRVGHEVVRVELMTYPIGQDPSLLAFVVGVAAASRASLPLTRAERMQAGARLVDCMATMTKADAARKVGVTREALSRYITRRDRAAAACPEPPEQLDISHGDTPHGGTPHGDTPHGESRLAAPGSALLPAATGRETADRAASASTRQALVETDAGMRRLVRAWIALDGRPSSPGGADRSELAALLGHVAATETSDPAGCLRRLGRLAHDAARCVADEDRLEPATATDTVENASVRGRATTPSPASPTGTASSNDQGEPR